MFESAEVGNAVDKDTYRAAVPKLRAELLAAQRRLAGADFAVVVLVAGFEGAGKSEVVNLLLEWLDARGIETHAMGAPTGEERQRPPMWRYWRRLPARGRLAIFFGSWDDGPLNDCAFGRISRAEFDQALDRQVALERMLHEENLLLVKIWLHLTHAEQKKRLRKLKADPRQRWRVGKRERKFVKHYDEIRSVSGQMLRRTNTAEAPWAIVEATDRRYRNLAVGRALLDALRGRLGQPERARPAPRPLMLHPPPRNVINQLDLSLALGPEEYGQRQADAQGRLGELTHRLRKEERSAILVFEGPDAAGKGGTIRRMTAAMDARDYQVMSVGPPTDEERAHPYLWRFWRHLPRLGKVTIYDRSWYGRVLVERVEGFARPEEWQRAFGEINDFEEQLTDFGILLLKFWLAISPDEQLRRFEQRQETPYKQYKLTPEDWRNRERWDTYEAAACDMVEKTSTDAAPWVLVEANSKEWARVKVLTTVVKRLEDAFS